LRSSSGTRRLMAADGTQRRICGRGIWSSFTIAPVGAWLPAMGSQHRTRRVKLPASHGAILCPRHDHENVDDVPRARRHSHAGSRLARPDLFLNSAQQVASIMVPPCCRLLASSDASIRRCPGRLNQPREISFSVFVSLTNLSQGVPTSACDRRPRPMWSRLHTWPRRTRDKELRY